MVNTKLISPALLQRHLHKVAYPATRDELIAHAHDEYERVVDASVSSRTGATHGR